MLMVTVSLFSILLCCHPADRRLHPRVHGPESGSTTSITPYRTEFFVLFCFVLFCFVLVLVLVLVF